MLINLSKLWDTGKRGQVGSDTNSGSMPQRPKDYFTGRKCRSLDHCWSLESFWPHKSGAIWLSLSEQLQKKQNWTDDTKQLEQEWGMKISGPHKSWKAEPLSSSLSQKKVDHRECPVPSRTNFIMSSQTSHLQGPDIRSTISKSALCYSSMLDYEGSL